MKLPNGLITGNTYSISLWVKPEQLTEFTTIFFGGRDSSHWISIVPKGHQGINHNTMVWSGNINWYDASSGMQIPVDEWSHLAVTVNEGRVTFYINGERKFSGDNFPNIFIDTNGFFALGVNFWDEPFKGLIEEVRIYEKELNGNEINE